MTESRSWPPQTNAGTALTLSRDQARTSLRLRRLDWDTEFFGASMGEVQVHPGTEREASIDEIESLKHQLEELLAQARAEKYAHVLLRAASGDSAPIWAAEHVGMRLVDVGIDSTLGLSMAQLPVPAPSVAIREAVDSDIAAIVDLAAGAFIHSRFHADPFFSQDEVAAFHRQWATNLCSGLARTVLVARLAGETVGFVACSLDEDRGRIPLIATKSGHRRKGVGFDLVSAAIQWFIWEGACVVNVKTQAHNYPALNLYRRAGFCVARTELTFSLTLS